MLSARAELLLPKYSRSFSNSLCLRALYLPSDVNNGVGGEYNLECLLWSGCEWSCMQKIE